MDDKREEVSLLILEIEKNLLEMKDEKNQLFKKANDLKKRYSEVDSDILNLKSNLLEIELQIELEEVMSKKINNELTKKSNQYDVEFKKSLVKNSSNNLDTFSGLLLMSKNTQKMLEEQRESLTESQLTEIHEREKASEGLNEVLRLSEEEIKKHTEKIANEQAKRDIERNGESSLFDTITEALFVTIPAIATACGITVAGIMAAVIPLLKVLLVVSIVGLIALSIYALWDKIEAAYNWIAKEISLVIDFLKGVFDNYLLPVLSKVWEVLKSFFSFFSDLLKKIGSFILDSIKFGFESVCLLLSTVANFIFNTIQIIGTLPELIKSVAYFLIENIKTLFPKVVNLIVNSIINLFKDVKIGLVKPFSFLEKYLRNDDGSTPLKLGDVIKAEAPNFYENISNQKNFITESLVKFSNLLKTHPIVATLSGKGEEKNQDEKSVAEVKSYDSIGHEAKPIQPLGGGEKGGLIGVEILGVETGIDSTQVKVKQPSIQDSNIGINNRLDDLNSNIQSVKGAVDNIPITEARDYKEVNNTTVVEKMIDTARISSRYN